MSGTLSVWQSQGLAKVKAKFISRMRGSQSDPTRALAPVWACLGLPTRALTRAERVRVRVRATTTL